MATRYNIHDLSHRTDIAGDLYIQNIHASSTHAIPELVRSPPSFPAVDPLAAGWDVCVHPGGWLYYFHRDHRIVVDSRDKLGKHYQDFLKHQDEYQKVDFSLEIWYDRGTATQISHSRCLADPRFKPSFVTDDPDQRWNYWNYIADHPSHAAISNESYTEAIDFLMQSAFESLFDVSLSATPFEYERSERIQKLLSDSSLSPVLRTMLVANVLREKYRFYHKPIDRDEFPAFVRQLQKAQYELGPWQRLGLRILYFGVPFRYLSYISEIDKSFLEREVWRRHIQRLVDEWKDFNFLAALILAATVGLLALQGITVFPRTATLISMLFALGSVSTGLYCISIYQSWVSESLDPAILNYQATMRHHRIRKSIVLSLPLVFLMWSVISFTVALFAYTFLGAGDVPGASYGVASVGGAIVLAMAGAPLALSNLWRIQADDDSGPSQQSPGITGHVPSDKTAVAEGQVGDIQTVPRISDDRLEDV